MGITTENYLKDLIKQKEKLVSTLQDCGVEASKEEMFNTLVPKVADAYETGKASGGNTEEAFEAGQQAEYDRFWDTFQENGNRTNYELAFAGEGWTDETFKPKYDVTATYNYATQMFWGSNITDLAGMLKKQNVKLITEGCKNPVQMFQNSKIETIPPLDFSSANGSTTYCFASTSIKTIERLKVSENTNFHPQIFSYASALKNIAFEGVIGTDISFKDCKSLTHQSLMSIINALKDFRLVNSTYSNVTYQWDGTEGDGEIGKVYKISNVFYGYENEIEFQCSWGDYETDYHIIVLKVRNLNITEEELSEVKTFMIDSNGNLVLGIRQEKPTTTKTLTLPNTFTNPDITEAQVTTEIVKAIEKGWTVVQ